jgi:hypothetical protein
MDETKMSASCGIFAFSDLEFAIRMNCRRRLNTSAQATNYRDVKYDSIVYFFYSAEIRSPASNLPIRYCRVGGDQVSLISPPGPSVFFDVPECIETVLSL